MTLRCNVPKTRCIYIFDNVIMNHSVLFIFFLELLLCVIYFTSFTHSFGFLQFYFYFTFETFPSISIETLLFSPFFLLFLSLDLSVMFFFFFFLLLHWISFFNYLPLIFVAIYRKTQQTQMHTHTINIELKTRISTWNVFRISFSWIVFSFLYLNLLVISRSIQFLKPENQHELHLFNVSIFSGHDFHVYLEQTKDCSVSLTSVVLFSFDFIYLLKEENVTL